MTIDKPSSPLVLAFVRDSVAEQILPLAQKADVRLESTSKILSLLDAGETFERNEPGEPIHGRDGAIFRKIVARQPLLMIFEVENLNTDWRRWVAICKSSPATRRFPIVLISQEVNAELRKEQKNYGANLLAPTDKFMQDFTKILKKVDRRPDQAALATACDEPLSKLAVEGIELFNAGEFFDAHEELEHAWMDDKGPARELYRGILQVGVAYMQIERGNYNGAIKMLMRVKQWLDPLPAVCRTVDVAQLRQDAAVVYEALQALEPDQIEQFDRSLFKPLRYGSSQPSS